MGKNVGSIDKIIRLVAGVALLAWAIVGGNVWGWIGIVPLATAIMGWCPAYLIFGINSCPIEKDPDSI